MSVHLDRLVADVRRALDPGGRSDAALLAAYSAGDAAAFEAIVRRHGPAVLATCQKVLPGADADDAFQAAFVALARDARKVRAGVGGWLAIVAHRTAVRMRIAARRRAAVEAKHAPPSAAGTDPSWRDAVAVVHEELDALPDSARRPLVLCYLRGLTRDEAAQDLGLSLDTLKGRLERGRLKLKTRLAKRGLTLSAGLLAALAAPADAALPTRLIYAAAASAGRSIPVGRSMPFAVKGLGLIGLAAGIAIAIAANDPTTVGQPNAAPAVKSSDPAEERLVVRGRVLGPDGKPVVGAKLHIIGADRKPAPQPETDAAGAFAFTVPPSPGFQYRYLLATAPGVGCDWAVIPEFRSPEELTLRLPEDVPINGRVITLEGAAIAGAEVRLEAIDAPSSGTLDPFFKALAGSGHEQSVNLLRKRLLEGEPLAALFHATTDATGRFTIRGIGKDRVPGFIIRAKGYTQDGIRVATRADFRESFRPGKDKYRVASPTFDVGLLPSPAVTGIVRDAVTKTPIAGVRVASQFLAEAAFLRRWHRVETTTDAAGRYTLDGTAPGKETVLLFDAPREAGYLHIYATAVSGSDLDARTLDAELCRGTMVSGRLTDRDTGKPIRAHVFYAPLADNEDVGKITGYEWLPWGPSPTDDNTRSDADGRYRLVVPPGPGLLHVQTWDLNPTVYPPTRLDPNDAGRVYGPAMPAMPDHIIFKTASRGGHFGPEVLNTYIVIDPKSTDRELSVNRTLSAGKTVRLRICDADGKSLTGVEGLGLDPTSGIRPVGGDPIVTGLDPERPRRLLLRHRGRNLAAVPTVRGDEAGPIEVRLLPVGTIVGRIVDGDGRGLSGITIEPSYQDHPLGTVLNSEKFQTRPDDGVKTDEAGRFRFEGIPPGIRIKLIARTTKGAFWFTRRVMTLQSGEEFDLGDWKRD